MVCGCGLRLGTLLRTRPDELRFKFGSRLSEKCQKKIRGTVVCGVVVVWLWFCGFHLIIIPTLVSTSTSTLTRVWQKCISFVPRNDISPLYIIPR